MYDLLLHDMLVRVYDLLAVMNIHTVLLTTISDVDAAFGSGTEDHEAS